MTSADAPPQHQTAQRVAFLGRLRARWAMLARAGDPDDQIATLRRAYDGLIANDLRVRVTSPR